MNGLQIKALNDIEIDLILEEGMQCLRDPGILIENDQAIKLLESAGAEVDKEKKIVSIPQELVETALNSTQAEFYLYTISGRPVILYGKDEVHFDPGSTALTILDSEQQIQRAPVTQDLVEFVKLVECLPDIDAQSTAMVCTDVVEEIGDLYRLYLALNFMEKPIVTGAFRKDTLETMLDLLEVVMGDLANLKEKPIAIFDICPSPPLKWSDLTCQNLIDCAIKSVPVELVSMPLAGSTAPVTLAAAVVQHTAENLSGVVIHQLANPGAPIVWGGSPAAVDMRTGFTPMGDPGTWLINAAYVQIGKKLNLPTHVYMGMSDTKIIDAQCGYESMGGTLVAALTGANMVSGAGMLDYETCQSMEKLVLDAEMIAVSKRFISGIQIREDPVGLDLIQSMGHHGDYLTSKHTRKWYREEQYIPSRLVDRGSYEKWLDGGTKSASERARMRVEELLAGYEHPNLARETRSELRNIAQFSAKKFGMTELPQITDAAYR